MPSFLITINGNTLDGSVEPATNAFETRYVLIQSQKRLNPSQKQELAKSSITIHEYVSKNTYLCGSQDVVDLDRIRQMDFIVYVDIYRLEFKVSPSLKEASSSSTHQVDVIFHEDRNPEEFQTDIMERSHLPTDDLVFCPRKVRLSSQGKFLNDLASIDAVRCIEDVGKISLRNDRARLIMNVDVQSRSSAKPCNYQGEGQAIAIADTGLDSGHPAFKDKKVDKYPLFSEAEEYLGDLNGHGTHVCGSAVGIAFENGEVRIMGTAPQAQIVVQCIQVGETPQDDEKVPVLRLPPHLNDLFQRPYNSSARVHSNSWGSACGAQQLPYDQKAFEIDDFVWTNPDMVICFAAGNDAAISVSKAQVGAEAAAKNCITIGASESDRQKSPVGDSNPLGGNSMHVADFSSRGPTKEGRVKPDVVAPGTSILSANSRYQQKSQVSGPDKNWCCKNGTSMATPLVAGCAADLRGALVQTNKHPSAALIKALLVNGAVILSHPTPSSESGFGRVNLADSISIVHGDNGAGFLEDVVDDKIPTSSYEKTLVNDQHTKLKTTLVWSDPPGKEIQNSLLLTIQDASGCEHKGDNDNNVQQVLWDGISPGNVTITVTFEGLTKPRQPFAVVWRFL